MNSNVVVPTWRGRITLALLYLASIAVTVVMKLWWRPFYDYVDSLPECDRLPWMRGIVLFLLAAPVFVAFTMLQHSRQLLQFRQSPLPHALVFFDTKVRRGWPVVAEAYILRTVAAVLVPVPIVFWVLADLTSLFFPTHDCGA